MPITKEDLWPRFQKRFKPEDVDEHVHEMKAQEAADINNAGLEAQFDYLIESGGPDWVAQLLDEGDARFTHGKWALEWEHIGEGCSGEYDEDDPEDVPLLRANLYYEGYEELDHASYCTMCKVGAPREVLEEFSKDLFSCLPDSPEQSHKSAIEKWTWRTEWPKKEGT